MTQVKIFVQPLDRRVGAFEVARVPGNEKSVSAALKQFSGGGMAVGYYPVPVQRPGRALAAMGGAR